MIERYTRPVMAALWNDQKRFETWLEVEIQATEAWAKLGHIPKEDAELIRKKASFDLERIYEIEAETHHDVVAFTRAVSESLGDESKWIHYGLTSTDVVDTAYGYQLKQVNNVLRQDLLDLIEVVGKRAQEERYTVCMGRTHGVHAEPTTFGLKLAGFYAELKRHLQRFNQAAKEVEAGKISGAVGTFANTPPQVEALVCEALGIRPQDISTQILPRDLHAAYVACLALIGTSVERFATEIRSLQRSEVREVEEFFAKGQKGSSAMPHKRNPIGSENVSGLARVMRGYMVTAYENVNLWHERDISHSSAERIILPDMTTLLDYQLVRFTRIIQNLTLFPERMKSNIDLTLGLIYSQRLMLKLVEVGLTREEAYDLVQPITGKAWEEQIDFRELVRQHERLNQHLSPQEIEDAFHYQYHLNQVDQIFDRLGL